MMRNKALGHIHEDLDFQRLKGMYKKRLLDIEKTAEREFESAERIEESSS